MHKRNKTYIFYKILLHTYTIPVQCNSVVNENAIEATFLPTQAPRSQLQPVSTNEITQPNNELLEDF